MKKTITLLGMLLAFFATAGAQQYCSTTATPYSELVSGKSYAVLVAADKNCGKTTDYSNSVVNMNS